MRSEPDRHHGSPLDNFSDGHRRRRGKGCLLPTALLLVLAVVVVAAGFWGVSEVRKHFGGAPDYAGPGTGSVVFRVTEGASSAAIGNDLKAAHVVESVQSFINAARANDASRDIQVGYYQLKSHMKATDALNVLINPHNLIQSLVVVPEGARIKQITATIVAKTDITEKALNRALGKPSVIGLPAAADGNPEGYLFPATYSVVPGETAVQLLKQMVAKTESTLQSLDVATKAKAVGLTEEQVLTMASILEYEASRDQDYPKVARAIFNRLHINMKLQSDATVAFANGTSGRLATTAAEREIDSPYNTYLYAGLPPGPIGSPGEKTIEAVLNPATGPWLFWVVVNLRTGETDFATTYQEHLANVAKYNAYCETSKAC
jgi:UPF0755 protein